MQEQLTTALTGKSLSRDDASHLMQAISQADLNASQVAALISALRLRPLSLEEIEGFRAVILGALKPLECDFSDCIDMCGTGGDGKHTFNISTLAAFVVAGAGIKVAKHGNYGFSSSCGSSNVLEALGIQFSADARMLRRCVDEANICFLHAPLFSAAFKAVQPIRRELGLRTFFNILGPLVNPARPGAHLLGVFSLELARLYTYVLQRSNLQFAVVHALDGYDEVSLTGTVRVITCNGTQDFTPADFGLPKVDPQDLRSGMSVADSARLFIQILEGRGTEAQRAVVIANAALAIRTAHGDRTLAHCVQMAAESLDSGAAFNRFQILKGL